MFKGIFSGDKDLSARCRQYLENGPPEHMENYMPESLTEIMIAYGAEKKDLDPELAELASIVLLEANTLHSIEDEVIREYMLEGAELVAEITGHV